MVAATSVLFAVAGLLTSVAAAPAPVPIGGQGARYNDTPPLYQPFSDCKSPLQMSRYAGDPNRDHSRFPVFQLGVEPGMDRAVRHSNVYIIPAYHEKYSDLFNYGVARFSAEEFAAAGLGPDDVSLINFMADQVSHYFTTTPLV